MKFTTRLRLAALTLLATAGLAAAAVVTITEPRPETGDGEIELLRKLVHNLDTAADSAE